MKVDVALLGVATGADAVAEGVKGGSGLTIEEPDHNIRTYDSEEIGGQWE